jgi:hypothetical protein
MGQLSDCPCLVVTLCDKVCTSSTLQGKSDTKHGLQVTKCAHNETALVPSSELSRLVETFPDRMCVPSFSGAYCSEQINIYPAIPEIRAEMQVGLCIVSVIVVRFYPKLECVNQR